MWEARILLIRAIDYFIWILDALIFVRCLMSWFPVDRHNGIVKLIYGLTEPILAPIRRMMFKSPMGGAGMPIDFSPVIAGILLEVIRRVLFSVILGMQIGI